MFKARLVGRKEQSNEHLYNLSFPFPCEIHLNFPRFNVPNPPLRPTDGALRVLTLYTEAKPLKAGFEYVKRISNDFDLILTNDEKFFEISNVYPEICLFGGFVQSLSPKRPVIPKEFSISNLYSAGTKFRFKYADDYSFEGYKLRKLFWEKKDLIKIPKRFYTSNHRTPDVKDKNLYPYSDKEQLMESMLSLVIENTFEDHWFTEKLIDCLRTYTVPVYFGCRKISKYFNTSGMILPKNFEEAVEIINDFDHQTYSSMSEAVAENFLLAYNYSSHTDLMTSYILKGKKWIDKNN